jgi:hypothetical protein
MPYIFTPKRPRIPWHQKINWQVALACAVWTLLMFATIKTTPESIVRVFRLRSKRRDPVDMPYIFTPKRPRIPWHQKINWQVALACAVWTLVMFVVISLCIFFFGPFLSQIYAKEIDVSVSVSAVYDSARWDSGAWTSPTGAQREAWVGVTPSAQIKYNRWRLQPTIEVNYRKGKFNFSNWEQFSHLDTRSIGILGGLTYDFKNFSIYGLAGVSLISHEGTLYEILPQPKTNHGTTVIDQNLLTLKLGVYKMWKIAGLKIGPEIACIIYPNPPKIERCRNVEFSRFVPTAGLRAQW